MQFSVVGDHDPFLLVKLSRGEAAYANSDSLVLMDASLEMKAKMQGGLFAALARTFANDESFFTEYLEATGGAGEALLAPTLPGDIQLLNVGSRQYCLADGAFLAAESSVNIKTRTQSLSRALFGGNSGFFVMCTEGQGQVAICGFGSIFELEVHPGNDVVIDNQNLVAWDSTLHYEVSLSTRSRNRGLLSKLMNSALSGEGFVTRFSGGGKVYVCSRNRQQFNTYLAGQILPAMGTSSE